MRRKGRSLASFEFDNGGVEARGEVDGDGDGGLKDVPRGSTLEAHCAKASCQCRG